MEVAVVLALVMLEWWCWCKWTLISYYLGHHSTILIFCLYFCSLTDSIKIETVMLWRAIRGLLLSAVYFLRLKSNVPKSNFILVELDPKLKSLSSLHLRPLIYHVKPPYILVSTVSCLYCVYVEEVNSVVDS